MHRIRTAVLFAAALTLAVSAVAVAASKTGDQLNKYPKADDPHDCEGGDKIVFNGAKELWPPNHKYRNFTVTADGDTDTEMVSVTTTVTSDQDELAPGSGHTTADVVPPAATMPGTGTASVTHAIRSERTGQDKDGRTYTIDVDATFDNGAESCGWTYYVHVAHDQRGGAGWKAI